MSYIYNLADTWDNAGTVFTAIKMNVTDVASNASSALLDLQVGGVSRFSVGKNGVSNFTATNLPSGTVVTDGNVLFSSTNDGALGPFINIYHNSSSPANSDSQRIQFWHNNSSATPFRAAFFRTQASSVTAGAESAIFDIFTVASGSIDTRMTINATGTTNFSVAPTANSVAIPTISSSDTLSNKTLSSPTLSGTVAGTPTFSSAPIFSAGFQWENNLYGPSTAFAATIGANPAATITNGGYIQLYGSTHGSGPRAIVGAGTGANFTITASAISYGGVAIPTISSTDTLSNKTLSSPTLSGTVAGTPTFSGSPFKIGDGTDTIAMTGTSPQLRVQGASFSTGITVRRDGNAEVGIQSTGTGNIGTWTAHNVQFMRNGSAMGGFDASAIFIGQVNNPRFYLYNNAGTASTLTLGADSADTFLGSFTNAPFGIYTNSAKRINIPAAGGFELIDGNNLLVGTATGSKIGTSTSQKLGFFNATPVVQPTAVANATGAGDVVAQLNALLSRMRDLGLIAT